MIADATFTDGNRVACPASAEKLDPLTAGFKLHFATRAELQKHGGVCKPCAEKFKKHNAAILAGKVETPGPMVPPPPQMPDDHAAWQNVSGENYAELTQTTDFDFFAVDEALGFVEATPPDAREQAAELVRKLFLYCFPTNRKLDLRTAAAKFSIVAAGMRPDILANQTQTELARQLGLTKAAMSKASVKFQDAFGVKFSRSRSGVARAAMREARLAQHGVNRNKKKAKGDTGQGGQADVQFVQS